MSEKTEMTILEKLRTEFKFVGSEQISGNTALKIVELVFADSTPSPALQDAVKEFQIDFGVHVRCHVEIRNGFIAVIMAVDGYGNPIESKDVFISPMQITSPSA